MNSKITNALLGLLIVATAYTGYRQYDLQTKVDELIKKQSEQVSITPAVPQNPPAETSPFDKTYTDPLASQPNVPLTEVKFDRMEHNFGKISDKGKVKTKFKFTNTGSNPLVISNATGSCGCTVPQWPRAAIEPGKTGEIEVEFDSSGKSGEQTKSVSVTANTNPAVTELIIKATVIPTDK
ncbi:MAG: DUF1573 domain-containing protein [Chitinophagales bacterium]|nr:DUF1573 domain-containing protein [Chitinophagales bacterium]